MSSATGALKKQSEIGDNEEQQSARRLLLLPDDKLSRARPLPRFFFFAFLLAQENIARGVTLIFTGT